MLKKVKELKKTPEEFLFEDEDDQDETELDNEDEEESLLK